LSRHEQGLALHFSFAILGFAAAGLVAGFQALIDSSSLPQRLFGLSLLICPAQILAIPLGVELLEAVETGTPGFYAMWLIIVFANTVIYALVGATMVGLRGKPTQTSP
jgi:hypothetical protein